MSRLEIILSASLAISVILNIGVFVYARNVVTTLLNISSELGDLKEMTDAFAIHVNEVYSLDMFYGDQTLGALMSHASSYNEYLDTFEYVYDLTEDLRNIEFDNTEEDPSQSD